MHGCFGIATSHHAAEQPEENWLPLVRGDDAIDVILRLYVPDLETLNTWTPFKAEKVTAN